uniref:Uncharacterized protein n=1 Tax=Setaria digitata TaxID=48799 RepID=A0A915PDD1_9BILA
MILLHAPETAFSHGWCCIPDPCPPSMTAASTKVTVVTPTMTSQSVTTAGTTPSATRPLYSDWTAWSCTESCGGCGVERRSRISRRWLNLTIKAATNIRVHLANALAVATTNLDKAADVLLACHNMCPE